MQKRLGTCKRLCGSDVADLNQRKPIDYVISTGKQYSVNFAKLAFEIVDLDYKYVKIEKKLYRPSEVRTLLGDCRKAKELKWKPKYNFKELVQDMVKSDLEFVQKKDIDFTQFLNLVEEK